MPPTQPPHLPRPSWDDLSARSELSPARQRTLEAVESSRTPLTALEVAQRLKLHHNTVREHLDALVEAGFVTATPQVTGRRGRPALLYSSTAPDPGEVLDAYLALLDAVADTLTETSDPGTAALLARQIGRRWAQAVRTGQAPPVDPALLEGLAPELALLVPDLTVMGFAPEAQDKDLVLRACPLVTGRRVPHDLVCLMHEGFLTAVLEQEDAASTGSTPSVTLTPLAREGCHLALG